MALTFENLFNIDYSLLIIQFCVGSPAGGVVCGGVWHVEALYVRVAADIDF